jgi:hypothetical protein
MTASWHADAPTRHTQPQLIAAFRNWQCVWLLAPDDERRAPRPPPDWLPASFAAVH